jgi:hypothetical protein
MALHLELIFAVFLAVTLPLETVNAAKPIEVYVVGEQPVSTATPTRSGRANNFTSLKYAMTAIAYHQRNCSGQRHPLTRPGGPLTVRAGVTVHFGLPKFTRQ